MISMNLRALGMATVATLALAGCTTTSPGYGGAPGGYGSSANCYDCGTVTRIEQAPTSAAPRATGAVLGGLVGAAAARELTDDKSEGRQNTATVAGAVAGAMAGNAIQNRMGSTYNVHVRMNDGHTVVVSQNDVGGIRVGSYVRVYNGRAWVR